MKAKLLIAVFAVAIIASFSFITIKKESKVVKNTINHNEPMSGFALEDENQF